MTYDLWRLFEIIEKDNLLKRFYSIHETICFVKPPILLTLLPFSQFPEKIPEHSRARLP